VPTPSTLVPFLFSGGNELDWIEKEQQFNIKRGLAIPTPKKSNAEFFTEKRDGVCLFCQNPDRCRKRRYKPDKGVGFICSSCVQHLLNANQDYLKRILELAKENGDKGKVDAIESFLIPEGQDHGQRKPNSKFRVNINRKRTLRSVRNKEERIRLATAQKSTALLQGDK
jgi:hypothetical protein